RHAAALQRLSVKQSRPPPRSNTRRAIGKNTATLYSFFILFYSRCRSVCPIADNKNKGTPSQMRKGGTIPLSRRGPTLSSTLHHCRTGDRGHIAESTPQCAPHHRAVNNGRDTVMHRPLHFPTTQVLRARTKWQTEPECTQTQSTPSLAEAHYSHGVTSKNTPAVAGCMEFP
ncbi:hypothetical protein TcCL_Unassigned05262, partial [Trypanosoma cruzi]